VLVPAYVGQRSGTAVATKMKAVLSIGGQRDSAEFSTAAYPTQKQIVLGRGLGRLPTGVYTDTMRVSNIYTSSSHDSVATGTVLVVNRDSSEFGRGWSLLGMEQVLLDPADSTRRIWLSGDGSARLFHRGTAITAAALSQSGLGGFNATTATDHTTSNNAWETNAATTGAWLRVDLGASPQTVTTLGVHSRGTSAAVYDVEYSDNATVWRTAYTGLKPAVTGWHWAV
jgi:F5/8 type C domain